MACHPSSIITRSDGRQARGWKRDRNRSVGSWRPSRCSNQIKKDSVQDVHDPCSCGVDVVNRTAECEEQRMFLQRPGKRNLIPSSTTCDLPLKRLFQDIFHVVVPRVPAVFSRAPPRLASAAPWSCQASAHGVSIY